MATDIRLKEYQSLLHGTTMDWLLTPVGLLDETEELATAFRVALGTDRLADINEVLPDLDSTDRRGWWGDLDAAEIWDGWNIGCKNWLLTRAKISDDISWEGATVRRAHNYTREALQPFIDKRFCSRIDVRAERVLDQTKHQAAREMIVVTVVAFRGPLQAIELRYAYLWDQIITM
jgi:phage gp46-like protein